MKRRSAAAIAAALVVGLGLGEARASQAADVARMAAGDVRQESASPSASRQTAQKSDAKPQLVESDSVFETAKLGTGSLTDTYRLAKYDVINVSVIGFPDGLGYGSSSSVKTSVTQTQSLGANDFIIGPDGRVGIPYAGNVRLAGLTLEEASETIRVRLSEYLRDPEVSVSVRSYGARKVYVMGEVQKPGIQELSVDSMNAYAAITSAGGYTNRGRSTRVQVVRAIDGILYYKELNMKRYMMKHDIEQNVALEDGDIVYVPRSNAIIWNEDVLPYINAYALYRTLTN